PEVVQTPRVGDEVDPFGCVSGEDDLTRRRRVQEAPDRLARPFVARRRPLGQLVNPSVDVRVRGLVEAPERVEHPAGLLRARRGGCHTLSAAKSNGQTGPNLDAAKPSYDAVVRQVSNGGGGMPGFSGRLSTGQIRDVASFVAASTKNNSAALTAFHPNHEQL